tara:strand:+ start:10551 stop:11924 length:1374 start_codon:yes stop_codon:yes gene_type:complete
MKTKTKIVLFFASIFTLYILIFSGFIYYSISIYSYNDFYKRLELRAITTAKIELDQTHPEITTIKQFRQGYLEKLPNEKSYILKWDVSKSKVDAKLMGIPVSFLENIAKNGTDNYRNDGIFYAGVVHEKNNQKYISIVSAQNYYNTHHNAFLKNLLVTSILITIFLIIGTGLWFSKMVLEPLHKITLRVNNISSENMHLRLPITENNDELSALARTFNDMLNRLETAFETQKNFISNASHELNTPLTFIIGEADVVLSRIRTPEEYVESINGILEEAEKLDRKTKALLFLAQTGYDGKVQKFEKVRIDQLLLDVKDTVMRIIPKSKMIIDFSLLPESPDKLKVKGNEQLLHLAFSNIIMNACKYSSNQDVRVSLGATQKEVIVIVSDKGIGIPESEMKYIYDPFFRASNTNNFDGYGIGLPLTRNVVKMHHGVLIVSSVEGKGTHVEIKLPIGNYPI